MALFWQAKPVKQYLIDTILPRPRDLLYLVKTALQNAINRSHGRIEEEDLLDAEVEYSHFALNSLMAENAGPHLVFQHWRCGRSS